MGSNDDFYDTTTSKKKAENDDWGWGADNDGEWSDIKSSSIEKPSKKSSSSTGLAKKKSEISKKSKNDEDLLIDFGASGNGEKKTADDSWANWENDAWESLSKKD